MKNVSLKLNTGKGMVIKMSGIMYEVPVIALKGLTILPEMTVHFDVSRKRSIAELEASMKGEQQIFLVTQKNSEEK